MPSSETSERKPVPSAEGAFYEAKTPAQRAPEAPFRPAYQEHELAETAAGIAAPVSPEAPASGTHREAGIELPEVIEPHAVREHLEKLLADATRIANAPGGADNLQNELNKYWESANK